MRNSFVPLLFCFTLLLCPCTLFAEVDTTATKENSLRPGAWALQFQVSNNFTLSSFDGNLLAIKRHFSAGSALRLGMSFSANAGDREQSVRAVQLDTLRLDSRQNRDDKNIKIDLDLLYLRYANPDEMVSLFVGGGPLFGYQSTTSDAVSPTSTGDRTTNDERTTWEFGSRLIAGVEWFVIKRLSLHAEYRASFSYKHFVQENTARREEDPTYLSKHKEHNHDWGFRGESVKFGLSVYL